ncbi:speckle-type POZ protein-like isoform X2 [Planococcus citri]|uniref:speckle-type POZ protein-like isoform X2 n=1 Tax=Planococcus citri TaxID=170843 RepID=UPI0031F7A5AC
MSNSCSSVCTSADGRWDTKIKLHTVTYIWRIENFSFHEAIGDDLKSPTFSGIDDKETKWYLLLKPSFSEAEKNCIALYVYLSSQAEVFVKFSICLLDQAQQEVPSSRRTTVKIRKLIFPSNLADNSWGFSQFHEKNEYFTNNLLVDDTLTFKFVMTYSTRDAVDSLHHKCINTPLYPSVPECNLSHHFGLLLEDHRLSDVVLSVNGEEYPAHKLVLTARSPVFAAMFDHNVKENEENRVYIDDMDGKVVSEMLRFIYTGKCENLRELATGLLAAADKYDLDRLKMICANELYENLSVENAASILALADMHGVKELKTEVIKFITGNPTEVLGTEGWKSVRSNFELADEVSLAIARREMPNN